MSNRRDKRDQIDKAQEQRISHQRRRGRYQSHSHSRNYYVRGASMYGRTVADLAPSVLHNPTPGLHEPSHQVPTAVPHGTPQGPPSVSHQTPQIPHQTPHGLHHPPPGLHHPPPPATMSNNTATLFHQPQRVFQKESPYQHQLHSSHQQSNTNTSQQPRAMSVDSHTDTITGTM